MTITKDTIDRILTEQDVPADLQADEELHAIAWSIARLDAPFTGPEERFYAARSEMAADLPEEGYYMLPNRAALEEICGYQLPARATDLLSGDEEEADPDDDAA
ncbi:hypothetical protein [Arthrobacter sp. NPDC056727]|uniref:hypothetical protein n=1 Tax=Arthrobacter sp. NPDC056727 TaxID=3345927 RepID=UPI00366C3216